MRPVAPRPLPRARPPSRAWAALPAVTCVEGCLPRGDSAARCVGSEWAEGREALGRGAEGPQGRGDGVPLWLEPCCLWPSGGICLELAACLQEWGQLLPAGHGAAEGLWQLVSGAGVCPGVWLAKPSAAADTRMPCPQHVSGKSVAFVGGRQRPLCGARACLCGGRDPMPGKRALCAPMGGSVTTR